MSDRVRSRLVPLGSHNSTFLIPAVVQFRLVLDMNINGLIGKRSASTQVTDAACPIELPLNSV